MSSLTSNIDSIISYLETEIQAKASKTVNNEELPNTNQNKHQSETEDTKESQITLSLNKGKIAGTEPNSCTMDIDTRVSIAMSIAEEKEVITPEELHNLLLRKQTRPIAYDGFEPSGRMHIAQGILKAINVNKLTSVGCDFVFWIADWFALLNNKMGGDLSKIRVVGEYMIEVWKAAGMNMDHVYFRWCSDDINHNANEYWLRVIEISKHFTITRIKRCCTILGREERDDMPAANLLYVCMQCSDIFFLKADICQLGNDQRKVNMLAREYAQKKIKSAKKKKQKGLRFPPVIIGHHMLMGLKEGQEKMSKSVKDSAIFMEDSVADVNRKIKKAFGPPKVVENNPLLDYAKHIVFGKYGFMEVQRDEENGGDVRYETYEDLEKDYAEGRLHPSELKPSLARAINKMLDPVRLHFQTDPNAKKLLEQVKKFRVTR